MFGSKVETMKRRVGFSLLLIVIASSLSSTQASPFGSTSKVEHQTSKTNEISQQKFRWESARKQNELIKGFTKEPTVTHQKPEMAPEYNMINFGKKTEQHQFAGHEEPVPDVELEHYIMPDLDVEKFMHSKPEEHHQEEHPEHDVKHMDHHSEVIGHDDHHEEHPHQDEHSHEEYHQPDIHHQQLEKDEPEMHNHEMLDFVLWATIPPYFPKGKLEWFKHYPNFQWIGQSEHCTQHPAPPNPPSPPRFQLLPYHFHLTTPVSPHGKTAPMRPTTKTPTKLHVPNTKIHMPTKIFVPIKSAPTTTTTTMSPIKFAQIKHEQHDVKGGKKTEPIKHHQHIEQKEHHGTKTQQKEEHHPTKNHQQKEEHPTKTQKKEEHHPAKGHEQKEEHHVTKEHQQKEEHPTKNQQKEEHHPTKDHQHKEEHPTKTQKKEEHHPAKGHEQKEEHHVTKEHQQKEEHPTKTQQKEEQHEIKMQEHQQTKGQHKKEHHSPSSHTQQREEEHSKQTHQHQDEQHHDIERHPKNTQQKEEHSSKTQEKEEHPTKTQHKEEHQREEEHSGKTQAMEKQHPTKNDEHPSRDFEKFHQKEDTPAKGGHQEVEENDFQSHEKATSQGEKSQQHEEAPSKGHDEPKHEPKTTMQPAKVVETNKATHEEQHQQVHIPNQEPESLYSDNNNRHHLGNSDHPFGQRQQVSGRMVNPPVNHNVRESFLSAAEQARHLARTVSSSNQQPADSTAARSSRTSTAIRGLNMRLAPSDFNEFIPTHRVYLGPGSVERHEANGRTQVRLSCNLGPETSRISKVEWVRFVGDYEMDLNSEPSFDCQLQSCKVEQVKSDPLVTVHSNIVPQSSSSQQVSQAALTIHQVEDEHQGVYRCSGVRETAAGKRELVYRLIAV